MKITYQKSGWWWSDGGSDGSWLMKKKVESFGVVDDLVVLAFMEMKEEEDEVGKRLE